METPREQSTTSKITSSTTLINIPRIQINSSLDEDNLLFTLSNVNVSIANALRRCILSDIPIIVFRTFPSDENKCTIYNNTCGLNNEIVKHRLSCIPIHVKSLDDFDYKNYYMELNVENLSDTTLYVTTENFIIKDKTTNKPISQTLNRELFPADNLTGDFIDFVRLKPKVTNELTPKSIHLKCDFDIGMASQDSAYNVVSTCSYGNTIDSAAQEVKLQQMKQKWHDEGKKEDEIDFEVKNWYLLEGKRLFKPDSFEFIINSIGIYSNIEIVIKACQLLLEKFTNFDDVINRDELIIKVASNTMQNCYDIILSNQDYTLGKVIEYYLYNDYYNKNILSFCGFKQLHPHDDYSIIRVAYFDSIELATIKGHLKNCISNALQTFNIIRKEFTKL